MISRRKTMDELNLSEAFRHYQNGGSVRQCADMAGVSRTTFRRRLRDYGFVQQTITVGRKHKRGCPGDSLHDFLGLPYAETDAMFEASCSWFAHTINCRLCARVRPLPCKERSRIYEKWLRADRARTTAGGG